MFSRRDPLREAGLLSEDPAVVDGVDDEEDAEADAAPLGLHDAFETEPGDFGRGGLCADGGGFGVWSAARVAGCFGGERGAAAADDVAEVDPDAVGCGVELDQAGDAGKGHEPAEVGHVAVLLVREAGRSKAVGDTGDGHGDGETQCWDAPTEDLDRPVESRDVVDSPA